ncbi:hypothetical protein JZX87_10590 [Agrobacterium sp. Ap1]|uniref:hypothetical protein n=1 Tax=Agrobacterium sp. Ap1 TaxID=2815337 RepID=UPI001A8CEB10|nr:hypothetical protein [Agrobacterium sp. Ap1]MBO0141605.1 hypothetical protein [Agrobacterium sp. Ap1]
MTNPYWHEYQKPHVVDFDEIRELCIDAFTVIAASRSMAGLSGDDVGGPLHDYFLRTAENRLSQSLLDLAVRMRTFEDILAASELRADYDRLVASLIEIDQLGSFGWEDEKLAQRGDLSFREACNKIIHAVDIRPVYDNGSNARDEDFAWGMDGTIELAGKLGKREWDVWMYAEDFLATCVAIANHYDPLPSPEVENTADMK